MRRLFNPEAIIPLVSALLYMIASAYYVNGSYHQTIKTAPMTWTLALFTVVAGYMSYVRSPGQQRHWLTNICNTADVIAVIMILSAVIGFHAYDTLAKPFDLVVAVTWLAAMLIWYLMQAKAANVAFNIALVIAYIPLVLGLVDCLSLEKPHGEPYWTWVLVFAASVLGLYLPIRKRDGLALAYALRSAMSTGLVLSLMTKIDGLW